MTDDGYFCWCPPAYTGLVCQTVSSANVTVQPGSCPAPSSITKDNLGCQPADVVFLIEYGVDDNRYDIDHEGDFIKELIDAWNVGSQGMQIGVVVYHNTVQDVIHLGSRGSTRGPQYLKAQISGLTRQLRPSGQPDLATALMHARHNAFEDGRPGVPQVLIPIVHQMANDTAKLQSLINVAQLLKDECFTIIPFGVRGSTYNNTVTSQVATTEEDHLVTMDDFNTLEEYAKGYAQNCASGAVVG